MGGDHVNGKTGVLGSSGNLRQRETKGICTVGMNDVTRVHPVAQTLAHSLAVPVLDHGVDADISEWHRSGAVQEVSIEHHHATDPKGDDVAAGYEHGRWVELLKESAGGLVLIWLGPAHRVQRPQGAGEPGVQDILVSNEAFRFQCGHKFISFWTHVYQRSAAFRLLDLNRHSAATPMLGNRFRFCGWNGFRPHRNLVPPPELTADAPIAKFSVPRFVRLGEPAGMERQGFISLGCRGRATLAAWAWLGVLFRLQRTLSFPHESVVADPHVPLVGQARFDGNVGSVRVPNRVLVGPDIFQKSSFPEDLDEFVSSFKAIQSQQHLGFGFHGLRVGPAILRVDAAIWGHHIDGFETVSLPNVPVVGVMGGGDFEEAGGHACFGVFAVRIRLHHVVVGDDGDDAVGQRQLDPLADQSRPLRIVGVHRDGGVSQHGLGTRGGHGDMLTGGRAVVVHEGIPEVPKMTVDFAGLDFIVGQCGLADGIPVHQTLASINEVIGEQFGKGQTHGFGADGIHGEPLPSPVCAASQTLQLLGDRGFVFVFPLLHQIHKGLAAQLRAMLPLGQQSLLHHGLGGDPRMVRPGHPQDFIPPHAMVPGQDVLEGVVERVSKVQGRRDVRGRHQQRVRRSVCGRIGMSHFRGIPGLTNRGFMLTGNVGLRQFGSGGRRVSHGSSMIRGHATNPEWQDVLFFASVAGCDLGMVCWMRKRCLWAWSS